MKKSFKTTTEGRAVHFCASEVFEFLSRLAVNGNNATEMIKQGVFAICESFLETSCENEAAMTLADTSKHPAIHWALRLLWRISFIREALFMFTFKDLIKCFRASVSFSPREQIKFSRRLHEQTNSHFSINSIFRAFFSKLRKINVYSLNKFLEKQKYGRILAKNAYHVEFC